MFTSITSELDFFIKIIWLALFFLLLSYVGLGFIFRLVLKIFKVKITNSNMDKADSDLLDLQLIKLYHGVALEKVSDVDEFAKAISSGEVTALNRWVLPLHRSIGKRKIGNFEKFTMYILMMAFFLLLAIFLARTVKGEKYDYARFTEGDRHVLISDVYVYNPETDTYYNKLSCNKLTYKDPNIIRSACNYMLTSDSQLKKELQMAIQSNNTNIRIVIGSVIVPYLYIFGFLFSYPNFLKINNEFYVFKNKDNKDCKSESPTP